MAKAVECLVGEDEVAFGLVARPQGLEVVGVERLVFTAEDVGGV